MKIALISDIHFGKHSRTKELSVPGCPIDDENTGAESLLDGLIEIIKTERVKYILVAGDLTSIASPLEYYYFDKIMLQVAQEAEIPIENIICVTGNHDNDWKIAEISEKLTTEEMEAEHAEILKKQYQKIAANSAVMNIAHLKTLQRGVAPFSGVLEKEEMILFAINTGWHCFPTQEYSHGKISSEQLGWLESELQTYKADIRTKVLLLHHHPIKYSFPSPTEDISLIEESSELLDLAGKYGINLVLHGHRHHPRAQTIQHDDWSHPISFVCAGSLSVNAKHRNNGEIPNTAHIIDFQKAPEAFLLKTYEYSASTGWKPLTHNRPEAPLDAEMWLGKIFQEKELCTSVQECLKHVDSPLVVIRYEDLPECLHYVRFEDLNKLFRTNVKAGYIITGSFPENISVISEEAIKNAKS